MAAGGMPMRRQCVRIVFAEMPLVPHGSSLRFRTVAAQRELPSHKAVRDQALGVQGLGKCVVDCAPQRSLNVSRASSRYAPAISSIALRLSTASGKGVARRPDSACAGHARTL